VGAVAADSVTPDLDIDDLISDAPLGSEPQDADDAFDLSLDDLETDNDDLQGASSPTIEQNLDEFSLDIDFDKPETKSSDDLDFDLALDDLSVEPAELTSKPATQADDDFSDFDLDLGSDTSSADSETEFSLGTDNDFEFEALSEDSAPLASDESPVAGAAPLAPGDFDLSVTDDLPSFEPIEDELDAKVDAALDDFTAECLMDSLGTDEMPPMGEDEDEDFDFLSGTDETATKLDLARAYIDMGDAEGARDILEEVIAEGSETQQQEARELIGKMV
jgi:pilus assembly protein FimV